MTKFKIGDKVKLTQIDAGCTGELGREYIVSGSWSSSNFIAITENGFCSHEDNWQLIEPKERTIEDVKKGDTLSNGIRYFEVLDVLRPVIVQVENKEQQWFHELNLERLKQKGWKIKSEPTEKEYKICLADLDKVEDKGCFNAHYKLNIDPEWIEKEKEDLRDDIKLLEQEIKEIKDGINILENARKEVREKYPKLLE